MKKISAFLLIFALLFSFAACKGNEEEETTTKRQYYKENGETTIVFENPNLTVPEKLFKVVDIDDYKKEEGKPNTAQSSGVTMIQKRYTLTADNKKAIPVKITSGSTEFFLDKTPLKDVVAKGWSYVGKMNETTTVDAGKTSSVFLTNDDGKTIKLSVKNNTAATVEIGECVIVETGIAKGVDVEGGWVDFTLGDSVKTDSSYETVVKALGAPQLINVMERYKGNEFSSSNATLGYEKKVGDKTYSVSIAYKDDGKTATLESMMVSVK